MQLAVSPSSIMHCMRPCVCSITASTSAVISSSFRFTIRAFLLRFAAAPTTEAAG
jgi:hypothetical protein